MAKSFTITTTATDTLKVDAKGHAEAVFIVTNATPRPVRGMARAKALGDTKKEWLTIAGEIERDFGGGATEPFTLNFDVAGTTPPASGTPSPTASPALPAGKYSFRLDVASSRSPDEDFTEGPIVTVEVIGAPPPTPVKKGGFPKWIIFLIIGVVLVVGGVILYLVLKPGGTPPPATPTPTPVATATETPIATPTATVAATPVAPLKLPALANLAEERAKQVLDRQCKTPPCVEIDVNRVADNKVPAGIVIRTEPKEGSEVEIGSRVTLFVSKGSDRVTILNVGNLLEDRAKDMLEKSCEPAPCVDLEINRVSDNRFAAGRVIRTDPAAGMQVQTGSKVVVFVSTGPIATAPPNQAAIEATCFRAVQGQIAWNYQGSTSWSPNNIQDLCRGTTNALQPAQCFQRVMHGGINWGGGTQWQWENARDLCMGTNDAEKTIACFQSRLRGSTWQEAIRACKSR